MRRDRTYGPDRCAVIENAERAGPRIGLVTVTYQSGEVLRPFLESVADQTFKDRLLVIVDNDSRDATREILRSQSDRSARIVLNSANVGVATGNNQGITICLEAGVEWILLINNDTELDPRLCETLIKQAEANGCRVLVPAITHFDEPNALWYAGGEFIWYKGGIQTRHLHGPLPSRPELRVVGYASTCCMLVHRSVFDDVGLMDDAYFVYWDDTDFCWRLRKRGISIHFYTEALIAHKASYLTGGSQSPFTVRFDSRNQIYFLRKHFSSAVVYVCLACIKLKHRFRQLLRLDSAEVARWRRAAVAEGLAMPVDASK
jgi:GT2 family glycosyltransferase